jgi:ABC-type multidrug transport system ATPase subunit
MTHTILEVFGLTCTAPNGTTLLDDVSFAVEAGWLVAVVGPTGAGKSSLAKALLGQLPPASGTVTVTGPDHEHGGRRGRVAGVPQEDATHPQLTLRRTLEHAAALRVGASVSQRRASVDKVLAELGLTSRAGTRLADLSGGERKRANVAVELVGQPDLLVLDEPTAGLDPGFEKSVFGHLRSMADTGRTIIAITHSMRVLAVCDRVLFLAPGGTVAFFGTPDQAEAYFDWDDPADAYAELATTPPAAWRSRLATHQARQATPSRAQAWAAPSRPSGYAWSRPAPTIPQAAASRHVESSGHLATLLRRALHVASSDRRALLLSLAAGPVVGLLLWAVLPDGTLRPPGAAEGEVMASAPKAMTFAFFLAMTITWLAAASAAREVVKERHILRREVGVGVSLSTYLAGKAMFLSGFAVLQVVPLAAIALISQQLPGAGPALGSAIFEVLVVSVLVGVSAVTTGLLVSAWASSSEKAMTVLPVVLVAQLALAGPWSADGGPVIGAIRQLIPTKWAASAVAATVLGDGSAWWVAAGAISAIAALQLGAALLLLHRTSPSAARGHDRVGAAGAFSAVGSRLGASRGPAIRFLPAGVAVVLALAAGAGAMTRNSGGTADTPGVALAAGPTTVAPAPARVPAAAPVPKPAAAPVTAAPVTAPPTTAAPARAAAPRTPVTAAPRTVAPAPVTAPPTTRPAALPVTAPPAPTPTTAPPAATAPTDPFAFSNWILQQMFQPVRR